MPVRIEVNGSRYYPDWMFFPMYPFETPKGLTGKPPFTLPDYLNSGTLARKGLMQFAIMATAIYIGSR